MIVDSIEKERGKSGRIRFELVRVGVGVDGVEWNE